MGELVHEHIEIEGSEVVLKPKNDKAPKKTHTGLGTNKRPFIYDVNTKNISFIQTSVDLERLGIQNNKFMLKLYDSSLVGVDPHSLDLTDEQRQRIILESVVNPWYFVRECVRIPHQGTTGIPFMLHRANLASLYLFFNNIDNYLTIPRQKGKTVAAVTGTLWAYLLGTSNSQIMYINKDLEAANDNLQKLKEYRDSLPEYMRSKEAIDTEGNIIKGRDNVKSITNPINKNSIVTKPSARSIEAASKIGRGNSQPIQYFDEVEFTPFIATILKASGPAFKTASENASMNNAPYGRIFTSTPGDLDTQSGQDALQILKGCGRWTEKMYDMTRKQLHEYVEVNAENGIIYIEYDYKQLGEGEKWLNQMSKLLLYVRTDIKREIHLQRIHGSNSNPFSPEDIDALYDLMQKPIREVVINDKFRLDFYDKIDKSKIYVAGVDCSMGVGLDNNAITFVDPDTNKPVAEFKSPYVGPVDFRKFIMEAVTTYMPRTILCIEKNMGGYVLVDELLHTHLKNNIYYERVSDITKTHDKSIQRGQVYEAMQRRYQGVATTGKSRELMMHILTTQMIDQKELFVTQNITKDISGLVRKNNRIDHGPGSHDDSLMSYLIARYVIDHGKNLHSYGYVPGVNRVKKIQKEKAYDELLDELPEELRDQFIQYVDPRKRADDEFKELERARLEAEKELRELGVEDKTPSTPIRVDGLRAEVPWDLFDDLNSTDDLDDMDSLW